MLPTLRLPLLTTLPAFTEAMYSPARAGGRMRQEALWRNAANAASALTTWTGYREQRGHRKAGTTSLMKSWSDFFFSACGRLLSHQKLNSSTPSLS